MQGAPSAAAEGGAPARETFASVLPIVVLAALALLLGLHVPEALGDLLKQASDVPGGLR